MTVSWRFASYARASVRSSALGAVVVAVACSARGGPPSRGPSLTLPLDVASGAPQEPRDGGDAARGAPPQAAAGGDRAGEATVGPALDSPDPVALRSKAQYEFHLLYDHGKVSVEKVVRRSYADEQVTARRMGRWALELCVGRELIERVRFDFPMLAGEKEPSRLTPLRQPPSFAPGAVVSHVVLVPESERATFARLVDRETGRTQQLAWPPSVASAERTEPHERTLAPLKRTPSRRPENTEPTSSGKSNRQ